MNLKLKVKKGDQVIVLSGDDKGKTGEVLKAMPKEGKSGSHVKTRTRSCRRGLHSQQRSD